MVMGCVIKRESKVFRSNFCGCGAQWYFILNYNHKTFVNAFSALLFRAMTFGIMALRRMAFGILGCLDLITVLPYYSSAECHSVALNSDQCNSTA